jgi:hypothetical protein
VKKTQPGMEFQLHLFPSVQVKAPMYYPDNLEQT